MTGAGLAGFGASVFSKSSGEGITSIVAPELAAGMVGLILNPEPAEIFELGIGLVVGATGALFELVGADMTEGLLNCPEGLVVLDKAEIVAVGALAGAGIVFRLLEAPETLELLFDPKELKPVLPKIGALFCDAGTAGIAVGVVLGATVDTGLETGFGVGLKVETGVVTGAVLVRGVGVLMTGAGLLAGAGVVGANGFGAAGAVVVGQGVVAIDGAGVGVGVDTGLAGVGLNGFGAGEKLSAGLVRGAVVTGVGLGEKDEGVAVGGVAEVGVAGVGVNGFGVALAAGLEVGVFEKLLLKLFRLLAG